ncbi:AMP-binding protein [Methanobrevibacter sp.]|uniref:AMP-binding protein n=1 Tax=Methanobrevibacter sp. TaxID=66852 RepID=UPI00388D9078
MKSESIKFKLDNIYNLSNNSNSSTENIENDYLSPQELEKEADYWKNYLSDIENYVIFHNIKSEDYKSIKIQLKNEKNIDFLKKHSISQFEFITAIFSLYLSRIDRTEGCLLKTIISDDLSYKNTLLKIKYTKDTTFIDYLNKVKEVLNDAAKHTKIDIDKYVEDILSYYSIYDFGDMADISILTGRDSALTLNMYADSLELIYNCDLFSDIYMKHMAANIESLIANVVKDSGQHINEINILSSDEVSLLSKYSKGKTFEVDEDKTLSRAFRENAIARPESVAVDDGVNKITYGELEYSSNSIAHDLKNNYNLGLGSHVALMLPRNYHYPELILALNKIGSCFIPIDSSYPDKRIEHMLDISEAECIITTKELGKSRDFKITTICIEDLSNDKDVELDIVGNGDDLLTIMFTSGTSGLPKGVPFSNKQCIWSSFSFKHLFNLSHDDVLGCYLSFSFIASVVINASLVLGVCIRIFNEKEQKDSLLLIKELKENPINSLILPPSLGIPIIENEDLKLDYLVLAGAKLNKLIEKERHTKIVNFYGTTEIVFAITKIYDLKDIQSNNVPIGRPITNTWVYILDKDGNQMPLNVPGEICVSSRHISHGYYNNPEMTNEVFVDNPHCTCQANERMYRTGDIGFYNYDGEIEIIGREDDQLSVRGFRIESDEILSIMKQYDEICDIYLDVDYDNLIAYYTVNDAFDINTVKEKLKAELPNYMIPSLFIELTEIPLNPNGKIDKFSLKENNVEIIIGDDVMNVVANAFKKVLHRDYVLIDDDFVALGGNSLSAMNLQILLKEKLGVDIYSQDIMELRTPVNITNHIKYNLDADSSADIDYSFDDYCPLSESQLNVYLDEMVNDMGTAYNNPFMIEFNKHYSGDEIRKAIEKLADAYPVLSARVIQNNEILSFSFDAKPQIINQFENDIESFVQPFELEKSLSRFMIVENDKTNYLCVDFHHLIVDGSSSNIILNSLVSILEGNDVDFIDNGILRQISFEEHIDSDYMENAHEFFDLMLSDVDETYELLPCVKTDDENDFKYSETFNIDNDKLNSFINNHSITPNQFFSSVFAYTLSRFTGFSKVLFNLIDDGRGHIDLSKSAGMFVRTLPLLIDCKNQKIDSFLDYSSNLINSVMKYDLYPFRILAGEYDLNSDITFQYSHDLFYSLINEEKPNYKVSELKHDVIGDLSFYIFNVEKDKMGIRILYSEKFSKDFIEHFAESYKLILKEIMDADVLSDINYTPKSDLDILNSYNQTENDLNYPDVLDAFNDNLAKYPDNTLVSFKDKSYSYSEGAFIADKLAKRLIELGVNLQDAVSFLVERSELYMFCTMGILSIGCIYVPLDDNLPDERIKFMLKDSGTSVVIVSDETLERVQDLTDEQTILLNISDIVNGDIAILDELPVVYGDLASILYTSGTTGLPKGVKSLENLF